MDRPASRCFRNSAGWIGSSERRCCHAGRERARSPIQYPARHPGDRWSKLSRLRYRAEWRSCGSAKPWSPDCWYIWTLSLDSRAIVGRSGLAYSRWNPRCGGWGNPGAHRSCYWWDWSSCWFAGYPGTECYWGLAPWSGCCALSWVIVALPAPSSTPLP